MIYMSHLLPDDEMGEVLARTGAGIESIEFSIAENLDAYERTLSSYKKRLKALGSPSLILHGPFLDLNPVSYDSEIRKTARLRYAQAYEAARELGAEKIVYHSCMYPNTVYPQGWAERVADFYEEFLWNRRDVEVVVENVFDRGPALLTEAAGKIKAPNFHLCLDIGHANCYSENFSVQEWARECAACLTHIHVHDNCGKQDEHLALGDGNIELGILKEYLGAKKGRTYTIECGRKEDLLKSYKKLTELLGPDRYFV